jgi:hypothetical protein
MVSKLSVLPNDPVSVLSSSLLSLLLSSGGSREKAAISYLSASLGVGSSWVSVLLSPSPSLLLLLLLSDGFVADRRVNSTIIFLPIVPIDPVSANPVSALSLLLSSGKFSDINFC